MLFNQQFRLIEEKEIDILQDLHQLLLNPPQQKTADDCSAAENGITSDVGMEKEEEQAVASSVEDIPSEPTPACDTILRQPLAASGSQ